MKSASHASEPIIVNESVTCYSDRLVIHLYYYPYGSKTIKYKDIHSCELLPLHRLKKRKYTKWGMGLAPIWWHSDIGRYYREHYLLVRTRQWPHVGITMDDDDIVNVYEQIIRETKTKFSPEKKLDSEVTNATMEYESEYRSSLESDGEWHTQW